MSEDGPHILILGGLGMIGRNLVKYLLDYKLVSFIRVVDLRVPKMAALGPLFESYFTVPDSHFEFVQGDLSIEKTVNAAFAPPAHRPYPFTIVVNLAAETAYGFMEMKYDRSITKLRTLCATAAAATGSVDKYIEVSTAQVYDSSNDKGSKEASSKLKPWTLLAKHHLAAEDIVKAIPNLPTIILRLPTVYGPGDVRGLMPRIVAAAVYQHLGQTMKFLWTESLRMHTIHVQDVAAALWHLVCAGEAGETYNLVDENDTSQGKFNAILETIFSIKTSFYGSVMSTLAKTQLDDIVDEANDDHMFPWEQMLAAANIEITPLSPCLEPELLYNTPCTLDGSKMKALGFECSCPRVTVELVVDSIAYWKDQHLFPS